MANKETDKKITAWLGKHEQWRTLMEPLREILASSELEETVKWGTPTYTLDGKNVVGLAAFKNHCALWFHQGVFLKDEKKKLVNAQDGTTKALRQWRFEQGDKLNKRLLQSYIKEAIGNQRAGKEVKPARPATGKAAVPDELQQALNKNKKLQAAFAKLTPGKQREYASHVADAKQAATRVSRVEKIIPLIQTGVGLHDKYRK